MAVHPQSDANSCLYVDFFLRTSAQYLGLHVTESDLEQIPVPPSFDLQNRHLRDAVVGVSESKPRANRRPKGEHLERRTEARLMLQRQ